MSAEPSSREDASRESASDGPRRRWLRLWSRLLLWGAAALGLLLLVGWLVVDSRWAREVVRARVMEEAGEALGRQVAIAELDFDLLPPGVEVAGIVVGGPDGLEQPLATVEQLTVEVGPGLVRSLFGKGPLRLAEVLVVRPEVSVVFYEDGSSNLPELSEGEAEDGGLAVRLEALHLSEGVLRLEEQSMPLDFSARGLEVALREFAGGEMLLRADTEQLSLELLDVALDGSASLQAQVAEGAIELQHIRVGSDYLTVEATGDYRDELLRLDLTGSADLAVAESLGVDLDLDGLVEVEAALAAEAEAWKVEARVLAPEIIAAGVAVRDTELLVEGSETDLQVEIRQARIAGGTVGGELAIPLAEQGGEIGVELAVRGVDLATVLDAVEAPVAGLEGQLSTDFEYRFTAEQPLLGKGRAELRVMPPGGAAKAVRNWTMPLEGTVPVVVEDGVLRIADAVLTAPGQRISADGQVDLQAAEASFDFRLDTEDPRALLRTLPVIYENDASPLWEPSRGVGSIDGSLTADASGFRTELDLELTSTVVSGSQVPRVAGSIAIDSGGIQNLDLDLERAPSSIAVQLSMPFEEDVAGFETPQFSIWVELNAWNVGDVEPWLDLELPFDGRTTGRLEIWGDPEAMSGSLQAAVDEIEVGGVTIPGEIRGQILFDPEKVTLGPMRLLAPAGDVELAGTLEPSTGTLDLRVTSSPLDLAAPPLDDLVAGYLAGTAELGAELTGTLESPRLEAFLIGSGLALESRRLGDQGASRLDVSWADGQLQIAGSLLGLLTADGGGRLDDEVTDLDVRLASDALAEILELVLGQPQEDLAGRFAGSFRLAAVGEESRAEVRLEQLELTHLESRLVNLEPVVVAFADGGAYLESFYLTEEGTGSELFIRGDLGSPEREMDLRILSSIDASWLGLYLPDLELEGQVDLLAAVRGTPEQPELDGQAEMSDGRLIIAGFPHAVENMHGFLFFYPERVVIDSGQATFAGGGLASEGEFIADPDGVWGYELRFMGTDLDVRYPEDWRLRGDMQLVLSESSSGRVLSGTVELERASFIKEFQLGFTQLLRLVFERRPELVEETDEVLVETRLNIAVEGPDALYVQTNLAELRGDLDFTLRGTLAAPVILGEIELARGGEIDFGGNQYVLERGVLTFGNPFRNDPQIDVVASAKVRAYEVQLNVFGPFEDLQTSLSSTPPLSNLDILSLLSTGSADTLTEVGSGTALGDGTAGAETFLASQAASMAGQRVGSFFGLDQVQITPLTGGSANLSTARITVGRRISRDVFVTYSYDPSESEEGIFELSWQIYPSVVLLLTRSNDGSIAVDMRWDKTF